MDDEEERQLKRNRELETWAEMEAASILGYLDDRYEDNTVAEMLVVLETLLTKIDGYRMAILVHLATRSTDR